MKVFTRIVLAVLALMLITLCAGFLMPSHYAVERSAVIAAPPESVWTRMATLRTWGRWSAWTSRADPTLAYTYAGPETGQGAVMRWTSRKMGDGALSIVGAVPAQSVDYELRMTGSDFTAHGHIRLAPEGGGTRVTWRDDGDLGGNPVYRLMGPMMDAMLGGAFERSLQGLRGEMAAR